MPIKSGFLDKLIDRMDRVDPKSLQTHFLRLAQERGLLETIFQSIQEGVIVVSGEGNLTYANAAAAGMLGFSLAQAQDKPIAMYLSEIDWARVLTLEVSDEGSLRSHELEVRYPEHRFVSFYIVPLLEGSSKGNGAVIILRDVTRDRLEEATVLESERLHAVKLLAAGVAHEIGNPLNALSIHLQLLDRELGDLPDDMAAESRELLDVARTEVSRLDLIITQFLRAVRPSKPNLNPADVMVIVRETLALLKQEIENRSIDVVVDCPPSLPDVPVDPGQIKQAFFNLIRNSFQAMPDGGRLKIKLTADDNFVNIAFVDTGVGIKPEDFGRLFEPYHTTKTEGSGLGLMIVQRIVQDHGGEMDVISKPEQGTTFTIRLPQADRRVRLLDIAEETRVQDRERT